MCDRRLIHSLISIGIVATLALSNETAAQNQPVAENSSSHSPSPSANDSLRIGPLRVGPELIRADNSLQLDLTTHDSVQISDASQESEWLIAPIPSYNSDVGATLAVGVVRLYSPNDTPTPWMTGVAGFYSSNKSFGAAAGHKMNLGNDQWRLQMAVAAADVNYDFYGVGPLSADRGLSVPINQTMRGGMAEVMYETVDNLYLGLRYGAGTTEVRLDADLSNLPSDLIPPILIPPIALLNARLSALGPRLVYDSRDSSFYPTSGMLIDVDATFNSPSLGSDFDFNVYSASLNHYSRVTPRSVIALRAYGQAVAGEPPFFALAAFGAHNDLRGYEPGKHRDRLLLAAQAEYRTRVTERIGVVAFGGVGAIGSGLSALGQALPSIGAGVRYVLAKDNQISMRLDAAFGRNDRGIYLSVGEAF